MVVLRLTLLTFYGLIRRTTHPLGEPGLAVE